MTFEEFYRSSTARQQIENRLIEEQRVKRNDPDWKPMRSLHQDGGFFINLRKLLWERYVDEYR